MKAVIYARVSSKEQEESGYSLESQEKLLREYAEKKDLEVIKLYKVSESASGKQVRKTFIEMFQFATQKGVQVILCEKIDRLTRNLKDAILASDWILDGKEREIHFVKENFVVNRNTKAHDNLVWDMKVAVSRFYTNNLSEEVRKGQMEKLAQGWIPSRAKLGYTTQGEHGHKIHIINTEIAPLVKEMFELYATGLYSVPKLGEIIHKQGLRSNLGNRLVKSRLSTLLSDPFYCGQIVWNDKIYNGSHEPLISRELFEKVQKVMHRVSAPVYGKHEYLFKGLMQCKDCGGTLTWEKQKGIMYGHCNAYHNCVKRPWYKEPIIDAQIAQVFEKLRVKNERLANWIKKALSDTHQSEIEIRVETTKGLQKQIKRLEERLDRLYEDRLDGRISSEVYDSKAIEFKNERYELTQQLETLSDGSDRNKEIGITILDLSQKASQIYTNSNLENKRKLLSLVFDDLIIDNGTLNYCFTEPFQILADAVGATNSSKQLDLIESPSEIFEPTEKGLVEAPLLLSDDQSTTVLLG